MRKTDSEGASRRTPDSVPLRVLHHLRRFARYLLRGAAFWLGTVLLPAPSTAQVVYPLDPETRLTTVPSPADVRGRATGAGFSDYHDLDRVLAAVERATNRVIVEQYGTSVEGRPLRLVWISDPENLARLDALRATTQDVVSGTSSGFPEDEPIFVWLSFGVHGDEASTTEAAIELIDHLTAGDTEQVRGWLRSAVIVIDPLLNPDGRERYVAWFRSVVGLAPDPDPGAREHRPPWPGGRTNHFYFDLNRDWAWGIQPETRARRAAYLATMPQIHVDFHEMAVESTYFFFPAAAPLNTFYPTSTIRWGQVFGAANGAAFDRRGWAYYTAEDFDLFYPGYGDSWPSFFGATGMTYEQAGGGRAGVEIRRRDGSVLTLRERIDHHVVAALTTIDTAVEHRAARLADFAEFWSGAGRIMDGSPGAYLVPRSDPGSVALAELLVTQGVWVDTLAAAMPAVGLEPFSGTGSASDSLPAGTFVVRHDQPLARYVAALMSPEMVLPDTSLFYDITGWALPYLFDVPAYRGASPGVATGRWNAERAPAPSPSLDDAVAMIWEYGSHTDVLAAARLALAGRRVRVLDDRVRVGERSFGRGSFVIFVGDRDDTDAVRALSEAIASAGASATPLTSFRTDEGVDLGSSRVRPLHVPRIALAAGPATNPTSVGAAWHFLAEESGLPLDVVRVEDLAAVPGSPSDSLAGRGRVPLDLSEYDVIVLPDGPGPGAWETALGDVGTRRLDRWVRAGGTLIGLRSAAAFLSADHAGLSTARLEPRPESAQEQLRAGRQARDEIRRRARIPGTLVDAIVDTTSVLGYGYSDGRTPVLVRDPTEFQLGKAENAWIYADSGPLAGYLPPGARERLAGTPYAMLERLGAGHIVTFADDPGFRGIVYGLKRVYLNAVLLVAGQ